MTRENCINKLVDIDDFYYDNGIKQFTIDLFDTDITGILNEDYVCDEEQDLGALAYKCGTILEVMRKDIIDCDAITRVKYTIEQRLKTIRDERD